MPHSSPRMPVKRPVFFLFAANMALCSLAINLNGHCQELPQQAAARVLPLIRIKAAKWSIISFDLENTSGDPLRYVPDHDNKSVYLLEFRLYHDGQYIVPLVTDEPPTLSLDRVRTLKPGETVTHSIDLMATHGNLKPGRYLIQMHYDIPVESGLAAEYGVTPLSLNRPLCHRELERP